MNYDERGLPAPRNFQEHLEHIINYYSQENGSDTPDFILAQYLNECLGVWNKNMQRREEWYGRPIHRPKESHPFSDTAVGAA